MSEKRKFKVTKKLNGQKMYRKWAEYDEGDIVVGKYIDKHTDNYEKENYVIEVVEAFFKDKTGTKYEGKNLVLNSCGGLDKAMEKVSLGELVQVEYTGTSIMEKGKFAGKEAHGVTVSVVEYDEETEGDIEL